MYQEIESGKISFGAAAQQYSTCPSSSKGGDLGAFERGAMVPQFDDYCCESRPRASSVLTGPGRAVRVCAERVWLLSNRVCGPHTDDPNTKVGELGIVRTKFGTHIVKLTKKP